MAPKPAAKPAPAFARAKASPLFCFQVIHELSVDTKTSRRVRRLTQQTGRQTGVKGTKTIVFDDPGGTDRSQKRRVVIEL